MRSIFIILLFMMLSGLQLLRPQANLLDQKLVAIQNQHQIVGMSVVVVKDGAMVFSGGYGLRDRSRSLPVADSTVYRIASISKTITAAAILKLYERGMLNLNEDASTYLGFQLRNPRFPDDVVTVHRLLSHTSSLRDGGGYDSFLNASYQQNPPPVLQSLVTSGGSYYTSDMWSSGYGPARQYFTYANINYGVLGTIVERISGQRFDIYCREKILTPLGISGSFNIQDLPDINQVAVLYSKQNGSWIVRAESYQGIKPAPRDLTRYVIGSNGIIFAPQGGLRISANDLAKLMMAQLNRGVYQGVRILADSTLERMRQPVWIYNGSNGDNYYGIFKTYGLGMHRTSDLLPGETLFGHPGEAYGLISDLYFSIQRNYGIIFITNGGVWGYGSHSGWYDVEEKIFRACLEELDHLTGTTARSNKPPSGLQLFQNQPNPFHSSTRIYYHLPVRSHVTLTIFDILGRQVAILRDEQQQAGRHQVDFLTDRLELASGFYFCRLQAGEFVMVRKMVFIQPLPD